jgi:hypothetical protein
LSLCFDLNLFQTLRSVKRSRLDLDSKDEAKADNSKDEEFAPIPDVTEEILKELVSKTFLYLSVQRFCFLYLSLFNSKPIVGTFVLLLLLPQPFWIPFHELLHSDVLSSGEKWSGAA